MNNVWLFRITFTAYGASLTAPIWVPIVKWAFAYWGIAFTA